jgi:hypothetical protein
VKAEGTSSTAGRKHHSSERTQTDKGTIRGYDDARRANACFWHFMRRARRYRDCHGDILTARFPSCMHRSA